MFKKFQQLFDNIMEDMNAAGFPGGVFGDGPGNVTTDPNIYAAMSIAGKPSVKGPKKGKKSKKNSKKFPIIRRNLQKNL